MNMARKFCLSLATASSLAAGLAAETFTVHPSPGMGDFTSPAAALASPMVSDGDRILVMPGTYVGTLLVDKALTLVSAAGTDVTILDAGGGGPVVELAAGATLRGFTITGAGGSASVGGVHVTSTDSVLVEDNVIADNHPLGDFGIPAGGVVVGPEAVAVLRGNDIHSNTSLSVGGVFTDMYSTTDMIGNRIRGNGPSTVGGALFGGSGRLVNVQITGNRGIVGGFYVDAAIGPDPWGATIELTNCTIVGNLGADSASTIGGVFLDNGGGVTIRNSIIHSNMGSPGPDLFLAPDFLTGPEVGYLDLDYSHVGPTDPDVVTGAHMVVPFLDPGFEAPLPAFLAPTLAGDYHLATTSPNLHAGFDAAFPLDLPALDLDGRWRFRGGVIDLGVFESVLWKIRVR